MEVARVRRLADRIHDLADRMDFPVPLLMAKSADVRLSPGPGQCSLWERALHGVSSDQREQGALMVAALAGTMLLRAQIRARPETVALLVVELLVPEWVFGLGPLPEIVARHTWAPSSLIVARWLSMRETGHLVTMTHAARRSVA